MDWLQSLFNAKTPTGFLFANENQKQTKYYECVLFTSKSSWFIINYFKEFTLKIF